MEPTDNLVSMMVQWINNLISLVRLLFGFWDVQLDYETSTLTHSHHDTSPDHIANGKKYRKKPPKNIHDKENLLIAYRHMELAGQALYNARINSETDEEVPCETQQMRDFAIKYHSSLITNNINKLRDLYRKCRLHVTSQFDGNTDVTDEIFTQHYDTTFERHSIVLSSLSPAQNRSISNNAIIKNWEIQLHNLNERLSRFSRIRYHTSCSLGHSKELVDEEWSNYNNKPKFPADVNSHADILRKVYEDGPIHETENSQGELVKRLDLKIESYLNPIRLFDPVRAEKHRLIVDGMRNIISQCISSFDDLVRCEKNGTGDCFDQLIAYARITNIYSKLWEEDLDAEFERYGDSLIPWGFWCYKIGN